MTAREIRSYEDRGGMQIFIHPYNLFPSTEAHITQHPSPMSFFAPVLGVSGRTTFPVGRSNLLHCSQILVNALRKQWISEVLYLKKENYVPLF